MQVQVKHFSIPVNQTSYAFDNLFTGALPDLVVIGLVVDADFAGRNQRSPFNFQTFNVNRIDHRRYGMPVPCDWYKLNRTSVAYVNDYWTFQEQLGFHKNDKCVALTP